MIEPFVIREGLLGYTVTCAVHPEFNYRALTRRGVEEMGLEHVAKDHGPKVPTLVHLCVRDRCLAAGVVASCSAGDWSERVFSHEADALAAWVAHAGGAHKP